MRHLISETTIRVFNDGKALSFEEVDAFSDVLDSIDFESIVKQKLEEKGFTNAKVVVDN